MSELIGILAAAALFAGFGLMRKRVQDDSRGCGSCPSREDDGACKTCQVDGDKAVGR